MTWWRSKVKLGKWWSRETGNFSKPSFHFMFMSWFQLRKKKRKKEGRKKEGRKKERKGGKERKIDICLFIFQLRGYRCGQLDGRKSSELRRNELDPSVCRPRGLLWLFSLCLEATDSRSRWIALHEFMGCITVDYHSLLSLQGRLFLGLVETLHRHVT